MGKLLDLFSRRAPAPTASAPAVAAVDLGPSVPIAVQVTEFFTMRSVLFVRGFCEKVDGRDPLPLLRLWDGRLVEPVVRPDPFAALPDERCSFSLHLTLPENVTNEQIARISVVLRHARGHVEIASPAGDGQSGDPYYSSEKPFWDAVYGSTSGRVLEVGSRSRSGVVRRGLFPAQLEYTGLDITAGENVDVVGDAHRMSEFLPHDHFDFAFSVSVWEHLVMPWQVSLELNRVLKVGGLAMIGTHQTWAVHEEPWDYFRFSEHAWAALFNADTGFEIVVATQGVKCVIAPARFFPPVTDGKHEWHHGCLTTRVIARKIGPTRLTWPVDPAVITRGTYSH